MGNLYNRDNPRVAKAEHKGVCSHQKFRPIDLVVLMFFRIEPARGYRAVNVLSLNVSQL